MVFRYFYKLSHEFLQIVAWFLQIALFLSANVVFSKILVYKFSGFVYKFSAFVCKFFCKFKGGANYLDLYGTTQLTINAPGCAYCLVEFMILKIRGALISMLNFRRNEGCAY